MALLRGITKSSECFLRNPSATAGIGWNLEQSYSAKKTVNVPPPPKKPLTGYMIFCKDHRKELLKQQPTLHSTEQIKKLAAQWNLLSLDVRQTYKEQARESTVLYGEAHKKYYENLTEEQKQAIAMEKTRKKEYRSLLKLKKALKESGVPKLPARAYPLFVQSCAKDKEIKYAPEFLRQAANQWKSLPESEKKKYEELALKEKLYFNDELEKWKKKMIAKNNSALVQRYEEMRGKGKSLDLQEAPKLVRAKKAVV